MSGPLHSLRSQLRVVNPMTRGQPADAIVEEFAVPMHPAR